MVKVTDLNDTEDELRSSYGGSMYAGSAVGGGSRFGGSRFGGSRFGGSRFGGSRFGGSRFGGSRFGGSKYGGSTFGGSSYGGSAYGQAVRLLPSETNANDEQLDPDIMAALEEAPVVTLNEDGEMEVNDDQEVDLLEDDFIDLAGGYEPKPDVDDYSEQRFDMDEQDLGSDFDECDEIDDDRGFDEDDDELDDDPSGMADYEGVGRGNVHDDIIEAQTALILKNFEEGLGFSCVAHQVDEDDGRATAEDVENLKEMLMQDKLRKEKAVTCNEFLDDHKSRPAFDYSKYENEENEEEFEWKEAPPSKPQFDCVSILSLNSNTRNLPTDIIPPSSQKKRENKASISDTDSSALPGLSRRELEEEIRLSRRADKASTLRPDDETTEERRQRKQAIKAERKERRQEKKANKLVFSMEKQKLSKEAATLAKSGKTIKLL